MPYGETEIIKIDKDHPDLSLIDQSVDYLKQGQVIAYPTETIYGLGADVFNRKAIKRIYSLKSRDYGLPISILVSDYDMLHRVVAEVSDNALKLMNRFWPGALTILFPASNRISKTLVTNTNKVGVRISPHPIATAIVAQFASPLTTTSANLSAFPPSVTVKQVKNYFGSRLPCIVDGGDCSASPGSTVVDLSQDSMRIIREGAIPSNEVIDCFRG